MKIDISKALQIAGITAFFSLLGCAQEPNPVVGPLQGFAGISDLNPQDKVVKNSVVFKGSDFFGKSCGLALSLIEEDGKPIFLIKLDYLLHGQSLPSLEAKGYHYDIGANSYQNIGSSTNPLVLAGAILTNDQEADLNQLAQYEAAGTLIYSLRIDLSADDFDSFEEALHKVVEDPSLYAAYESTLNQIQRLVFKLGHTGHYDASGCVGLKADTVKLVEYELDEDHDHDHGDDDDHDDHDDHDDDHGDDHDHE